MRVALVGTYPLDPEDTDGGVVTSTMNLLEGLRHLEDLEIHLVTCNGFVRSAVQIERDGVVFHYLPSFDHLQTASLYLQDRISIGRRLSQINPDIVHAQNAQNYGYICLQTRYPVAISIHGIVKEEAKYLRTRRERLRAILRSEVIQRHCVRNAPHVIQPTPYPEQYFSQVKSGVWHDTGNAIASRFFDIESASEAATILYSGAVIPRKRLLDLVRALVEVKKTSPEVDLRVAGSTPDTSYLRTIQDFINRNDLRANVTFLGGMSQDTLVDEYRRCTLLVLPSGQETSPMVIAEIMAVGKPVVATRVGGVPYLIDDGDTGFIVDVGNIDALANRINAVLSDGALQERMSRSAKEKATRNYRCEVVANRVRQVYVEAISTYSASRRSNRLPWTRVNPRSS